MNNELIVTAKAELVDSNFDDFKEKFKKELGSINTLLLTDDDFLEAKENVKNLKDNEDKFKEIEEAILSQILPVKTIIDGVRELSSVARTKRLLLNDEVGKETEKRKEKAKNSHLEGVDGFILEELKKRIELAAKGKKTIKSINSACEEVKTELLGLVEANKIIVADCKKDNPAIYVDDMANLLLMDSERLKSELELRKLKLENSIKEKEAEEAKEAEQKKDREFARMMEEPSPTPTPVEELDIEPFSLNQEVVDESWDAFAESSLMHLNKAIGWMIEGAKKIEGIDENIKANKIIAEIESARNKLIK